MIEDRLGTTTIASRWMIAILSVLLPLLSFHVYSGASLELDLIAAASTKDKRLTNRADRISTFPARELPGSRIPSSYGELSISVIMRCT
jgi:hypothetical protein